MGIAIINKAKKVVDQKSVHTLLFLSLTMLSFGATTTKQHYGHKPPIKKEQYGAFTTLAHKLTIPSIKITKIYRDCQTVQIMLKAKK